MTTPKNKAAKAAYDKLYYKRNTERIKANVRKHVEQNRDLIKKYKAEHYKTNLTHYKERSVAYYQENSTKIKQHQVKTRASHKLAAMEAYGGPVCKLCSESRLGALHVDHVASDGAAHRRELGSKNIYRWLCKNNYPVGFRILCANCNHKQYLTSRVLLQTKSAISDRRILANTKFKVMQRLGGKCITCDQTDLEVLTVHHVNHDGAEHRRTVSGGYGSTKFYRWLLQTGDFTGLECRCFSCNDNEAFLRYKECLN